MLTLGGVLDFWLKLFGVPTFFFGVNFPPSLPPFPSATFYVTVCP